MLMALFIWLDAVRYRVYIPLYIAGKCIGIFILMTGWFIFSIQVTIIESFILSGDLFALAAILLILKDIDKESEKQAITDVESFVEDK